MPRILLALILVALAGAAVLAFRFVAPGSSGAEEAASAFAAAWSRGDDRAAARAADDPERALADLTASRRGLDGASAQVRVREVTEEEDDRATATLRVDWRVPRIGPFGYDTRVALRRADDRWAIAWSGAAVHPGLGEELRLGTAFDAPRRGPILDRAGRALMRDRPVVDVAVEVPKVEDPAATVRDYAALVDVDAARLERAIRRPGEARFVPVVTLREADFRRVEDELTELPGVSLNRGTAPLAPTRGFGRALLGAVGPVTAEQLERLGERYVVGDDVGQFGLQAAFEERLAGAPSARVVTRYENSGTEERTLLERGGRDGRPLRTTLDRDVQAAAEAALGAMDGRSALVAVQPSTGDVLAVANRPLDEAFNRAFEGLYPPGSTFKVVSTAALLRAGLDVSEVVDCPATRTVGGRSFRNFEGSAAGAVPFSVDFAESCNTAFVSLAERLERDALTRTARDYGLGEEPRLPLPAATSDVPPGTDEVARAATMIGQDRIVASPLAMAGVAAAVADGRWRAPRLLASGPSRAGEPLPGSEATTLRTLMRAVVTGGTGDALAGVPGEVRGKSGTAEFGSGDPPPTHAWFIAQRDDIALAVLVEGGSSGGAVAAPLARAFFTALDGNQG